MSIISPEQAVTLLQNEEVVALPTETVYGLAGRIDSEIALRKIFSVKQRPFFDPLIVHVCSADQARELWQEWPEVFNTLINRFWPGPLTLIATRSKKVSSLITSGLDTVAIRCPNHPVMLKIIQSLGVPLAAPSANRFGKVSPTQASHVDSEFSGAVPVVDGGACSVGVESTVLAVKAEGKGWNLKILRPGGVSRESIHALFVNANVTVEREQHSPASPGHLKVHYQPDSPVIILNDKAWSSNIQTEVERKLSIKVTSTHELILSPDPTLAARELYEKMRQQSTWKVGHILFINRKSNLNGELWEAIWDRLERASSLTL